jgi:C4-dicarboxylate-specific signal transduction histidine kinase
MTKSKFTSLKRILLLRILLVSSLITALLTVIQFYSDYAAEMSELDATITQLETVTVPSVAENLWNVDDSALSTRAKSLIKLKEIINVKILDEVGDVVAHAKDSKEHDYNSAFVRSFQLTYQSRDLGNFEVTFTKRYIYNRLINRLGVFAMSQGIKTFVVSLIILYIFGFYVTSHLVKMARYLKEEKYRFGPLVLEKAYNKTNTELDIVVDSINKMSESVIKVEDSLRDDLEIHRASAINAARLASLGEMAGGIAHEINNPLAIIDGYIQVVKQELSRERYDPDRIKQRLDKASTTVDRIAKIINGLKVYARNASGDPMDLVSVKDIIEHTLPFCTEKFKNRGVKLIVQQENLKLKVKCRETEISQVLVSLMNNAFDAIMELEDKWIKIIAREHDSNVIVEVVDSGSGIKEDVLVKVFDPFFTTKKVGKGTGLGLSISRGIVENHGGEFKVDSDNPNTCFQIILPRV